MKSDSPYWDLKNGVCTKHWLPQVPCPQCLAEKDEDVEWTLTRIERDGIPDMSLFDRDDPDNDLSLPGDDELLEFLP